MSPAIAYIVALLVPLAVKTALYVGVFRWRKRKVSLLTSIILAGSPLLLSMIPIPLPGTVAVIIGIGIALYVLSRYTEVPLVPEGLVIVCGVEVVSQLLMRIVTGLIM